MATHAGEGGKEPFGYTIFPTSFTGEPGCHGENAKWRRPASMNSAHHQDGIKGKLEALVKGPLAWGMATAYGLDRSSHRGTLRCPFL